MQRLMLDGPGALHWEDADEPVPATGQAVVRPIAVATCDLDVGVLHGSFPLPGPYPFGHEGVAEVSAVGAGVTSVVPGDLVIVPFQISCGSCPACRRGRTGNCVDLWARPDGRPRVGRTARRPHPRAAREPVEVQLLEQPTPFPYG